MNVNNFFKFIGSKFPEYNVSSDNKGLKDMFHDRYEKDIIDQNIDEEDAYSMYMGVPNQSTVDENGKNGKFVQYNVESESYNDDGGREYNFKYYTYETDFKNDIKDGHEILYNDNYRDGSQKMVDTEYSNGKKIKKTRFKYFYIERKHVGPFVMNVTHYDENEKEYAVDTYRFLSKNNGTEIIGSELSQRRISYPNYTTSSIIYFDANGNEISKGEWDDLYKNNK